MAAEDDRSTRRSADPLVAGVSDGVAAGYQALEHVLEGLRESLRHRGGGGHAPAAPVRPAHRRRGRAEPAGSDVLEDLAEVAAELLERGADVAQEVAGALGDRRKRSRRPAEAEVLFVHAAAGAGGTVEFHITNTSGAALRNIEFFATELMFGADRIGRDEVGFKPDRVDWLAPGRSLSAVVSVAVPGKLPPGTYRGLVGAEPGGAWAVLELEVRPAEVDGDERPGAAEAARPE